MCIRDSGTGGGDYDHGLRCSGINTRWDVQDIKFINYNGDPSGDSRIGLVFESECDAYHRNIHADGCTWCGIYAFSTVRHRGDGGILNACRSGFIANCTEATLGSSGARTQITNSTESGIYWSRGSQGHVDYCDLNDNAIGLLVAENSRVDTVNINFKRNTFAIRTQTGGVFGEGGTANVYNSGTADANTTIWDFKAGGGDSSQLRFSEQWVRFDYDRTTRTASGITAGNFTSFYTLPAYRLQGVGKSLRVTVYGTITATAGSTVGVDIGGMSVPITVPSAVTGVTFVLTVTLHEVSGGYRAFAVLQTGLNLQRLGTVTAGFVNSVANNVSTSYSLTGAGDSINVYRQDLELIG